MRWAAQLEHHVVGNIHQSGHAALAAARQAVHHPLRRLGLRVEIAYHATGKTATQVRRANRHLDGVGIAKRHRREIGLHQRRTGKRCHFAGHAVNAQAMRQIGRELEGEQRVVQIQVVPNALTQGRVWRQFQQTAVVIGELQFFGRTQHALAFDTAQLPDLDNKRLAVRTGRQLGAHQGAGHANADAGIGRTAHDIEQLGRAHIHLAHPQAIGVGVLVGVADFTDHDVAKGRRHRLEFFHFKPSHSQRVGELRGGKRRVAKGPQPGFRELHRLLLGLLELREKADVAVKKQPKVVDAIAQHGQAVWAHAKGKAGVFFRVQAHVANHVGVHLPRPCYLQPTSC